MPKHLYCTFLINNVCKANKSGAQKCKICKEKKQKLNMLGPR